jgi:long-chain acyl-CoA synthetase
MTTSPRRPWLALYPEGMPHDVEVPAGTMLDRFDATVARLGERPLAVYFDSELSANEVDRASDALACALADLGVSPGDRVALYMQNVPQYLLALVAIWKLGAIATSANPMYKGRELSHLLTDAGVRVLIALESLHESVAADVVADTPVEHVVTTSELDWLREPVPRLLAASRRSRPAGTHDMRELVERYDGQRPARPPLDGADPALVTYTAGTTGPAKGAINTHTNMVFATEVFRRWHDLRPGDGLLALSPLFHMTGLLAHLALGVSAAMPILLSYRFDAETIFEQARRRRPTFTVAAITAYIALMNHAAFEREALASMEKAITGGAPTAPATLEEYEARTGVRLRIGYGMTESTSPALQTPPDRRLPVDPGSGALSIGIPVFNTMCEVVNDQDETLAPGEVGELVLTGPQVIPGYWNKPEETAKALPGGRLHTGDVGFMDDAGWFYLIDRRKDMINASGFKVWPREVEDVLYEHEAVREAAVLGVADGYRGETIHAYVALREGAETAPQELIAFCRERLAAYKCPREVIVLDELPKSAAGKILRRDLRPVGSSSPAA